MTLAYQHEIDRVNAIEAATKPLREEIKRLNTMLQLSCNGALALSASNKKNAEERQKLTEEIERLTASLAAWKVGDMEALRTANAQLAEELRAAQERIERLVSDRKEVNREISAICGPLAGECNENARTILELREENAALKANSAKTEPPVTCQGCGQALYEESAKKGICCDCQDKADVKFAAAQTDSQTLAETLGGIKMEQTAAMVYRCRFDHLRKVHVMKYTNTYVHFDNGSQMDTEYFRKIFEGDR